MPEEPAHLGEPRRIARLLAHQDVDDVARDQIEEEERQHRDAEEHGDEDEEPLAQEPEHRERTTSARRPAGGSIPPAGHQDHLSSQVSLSPYRLMRFGL